MADETGIGRALSSGTRVEILKLLARNGPMSHSEIRESLGGINTGKLNYHLKVLGDLISKDREMEPTA